MRNTTMQDKLTQVLGAASISRPMVPLRSKNVLIANANRGARRLQSFNRERGEESPFPPRYRVPPKKEQSLFCPCLFRSGSAPYRATLGGT